MKKDCKHIKELISCKLDGELEKADQIRVEKHIARCADCKDFSDDLTRIHQQTHTLFSTMKESIPGESLWDRIEAQLDTPVESDNIVTFRRRSKKIIVWISTAVAASILLFIGTLFVIYKINEYSVRNYCVVNSVESKKSSVMMFKDNSTNTTIIWMSPKKGAVQTGDTVS